jgi:hypothetical protein
MKSYIFPVTIFSRAGVALCVTKQIWWKSYHYHLSGSRGTAGTKPIMEKKE